MNIESPKIFFFNQKSRIKLPDLTADMASSAVCHLGDFPGLGIASFGLYGGPIERHLNFWCLLSKLV